MNQNRFKYIINTVSNKEVPSGFSISIWLHKDLNKALEFLSLQLNMSKSELIRKFIKEGLERI